MSKIGELGMGAADSALGQGLGLIFGGIQNARQRNQAKKLGDIQLEQNKKAAEHSQKLAMQMRDSSISSTVEQMKKEGLNIGLMYGGGGAGGATATGAGSVSGVSGTSAEGASAGVGMGMQLASQLALMKAQKENIEADTENKKAGTEKTGVDTESGKVDLSIKKNTENEQIQKIQSEAEKALYEADIQRKNGMIKADTWKDEVQGIKAEAAGEMLKNLLTEANIKLSERRIWEIAEKVAQGWKGIEFQGVDKVTGKYIEQVIDFMKKLTIGSGGN